MVRSSAQTRTIRLSLAVCLTGLVLVLGFLLMRGNNPNGISSRDIPMPFGTRSASVRGQLSDVGSTTDNRPIVDMKFDAGEISETFGSGAVTFIVTPPDASSFSSGAPLSITLTAGKKFYGYKYTSVDATQEKAMQVLRNNPPLDAQGNPTAYTFSQLFPGTFFASDGELNDPHSFVNEFHETQDVTFVSVSQLKLEANTRYLIIAEEDGISMTVRGLTIPPDITFTTFGTVPWYEETFTIPKPYAGSPLEAGFYAYVNNALLNLNENMRATKTVGTAPLGPVNYWWYPLVGPQSTIFGYPIIFNAYFTPCYAYATSMRQCSPGEVPINGKIALTSPYAFSKGSYIGEANWKPIASMNPSVTLIGDYPAVLSGSYAIRVRGKTIEVCSGYSCGTMSTLTETGADIVKHDGSLYVMSADGKHVYQSKNARQWKTLSVGGIDFTVRKKSLVSKDGHLWIVGRRTNEAKDRVMVWPPLTTYKDDAFVLGIASGNTTDGDSGCADNNHGRQWRLPTAKDMTYLGVSLPYMIGDLAHSFFRIGSTNGISFPITDTGGQWIAPSSNSNTLLCIADPLPTETKPATEQQGCVTARAPTTSSGGEIRFLAPGASYAVRMEDSCVSKTPNGVFKLTPTCADLSCWVRTATCSGSSVTTKRMDCPIGCRDGICMDPLENGQKVLTSDGVYFSTTINHYYSSFAITTMGKKIFIHGQPLYPLTAEFSAIDGTSGVYNNYGDPDMWPSVFATTSSGSIRGFGTIWDTTSRRYNIGVMDWNTRQRIQTLAIRSIKNPFIGMAGTTLFALYDDQRYAMADVNGGLSGEITLTQTGALSSVVSNPVGLVATGSTVVAIGSLLQNGVTVSGASIVNLAGGLDETPSVSNVTLDGAPTRITLVGTSAYIFMRNSSSVSILDITTGTADTIVLSGQPTDITFDGANVYIPTYSEAARSSTLSIIDPSTHTISKTIAVPTGFSKVRIAQHKAYMIGSLINGLGINGYKSYVLVIDMARGNAVQALKLPSSAYGLEVINNDVLVFMMSGNPPNGMLFVIDALTDTLKQ